MVLILSRVPSLPAANAADARPDLKKPNHGIEQPQQKVLSLRIGALGFEPDQLSVTQGEYFLVVFNSIQSRPVRLILARGTGEHEKDIVISRESPRWKSSVRLVPGRYVVKSPDHPDWSCHITVTAN